MLDLAYSSLMFNSTELAQEVDRLEDVVDKLHTDFELLALSSDFRKSEAKGFLGLIRLGVAAEKIADAAALIADVVLRGIEPHAVLKLTIREAEERIVHAHVGENSLLANRTLKDLRFPEETGMRVLAIRREGKCVRPKPDSIIKAGDILIASGYAEGEQDLKKMVSSTTPHEKC